MSKIITGLAAGIVVGLIVTVTIQYPEMLWFWAFLAVVAVLSFTVAYLMEKR